MKFFLLSLVVAGNIVGDLLKAAGMRRLGEVDDFRPSALARLAGAVSRSALVWLSIGGYAVSFFGFLALLSIAEVSFAVPATAAGYVAETVLARYFLKEAISARRWAGAGLVAVGVALISA